jgi:Photosynthetic reaction centre cytochrome C subunit
LEDDAVRDDFKRFLSGVSLLAVAACATAGPPRTVEPAAAEDSAATTPSREPSNQEINDRYEEQIAERIASRKNDPAAQVFRNIQIEWLKDVPAGRLLVIMNYGYSRALGVNCTHCHVEQDFASDEKRPKRAAREMAVMHRMINDRLRNMQNLEAVPDDRTINCFTCHRGTVDPTKTDS